MKDQIARAMAAKGRIRAVACVTTGLVNDICLLQETSPVVTVALGRAISGAALLGSNLKNGQRLALKFEGSGPMKKMIVETDWDGALRATVAVPDAVAETVPAALGLAGFLTVKKDLGIGEPYSGMVQLSTSEIAEDIAYYLTDSEQIPSAVGLSVTISEDGQAACAGGFLIQSLPPSDTEAVEQIMSTISELPSVADLLQNGTTPQELLEILLAGVEHHQLESGDLVFRCGCSIEKAEKALLSLGKSELAKIAEEDDKTDITCEFCKKKYHFERNDIEALSAES